MDPKCVVLYRIKSAIEMMDCAVLRADCRLQCFMPRCTHSDVETYLSASFMRIFSAQRSIASHSIACVKFDELGTSCLNPNTTSITLFLSLGKCIRLRTLLVLRSSISTCRLCIYCIDSQKIYSIYCSAEVSMFCLSFFERRSDRILLYRIHFWLPDS